MSTWNYSLETETPTYGYSSGTSLKGTLVE